jgi:hypothetical protein
VPEATNGRLDMSEIEKDAAEAMPAESAGTPAGPATPFWLTPRKVVVVVLALYLAAFWTFADGTPENQRFFGGPQWALFLAFWHPLALPANLFFLIGIFEMLGRVFGAAVLMGWLAIGFALVLCLWLGVDARNRPDFVADSTLVASLCLWILSFLLFTLGATRLYRVAYRRYQAECREYDRLRSRMTDPDRIGDVHVVRPASPAHTNIADRKAIDGTTEQG